MLKTLINQCSDLLASSSDETAYVDFANPLPWPCDRASGARHASSTTTERHMLNRRNADRGEGRRD